MESDFRVGAWLVQPSLNCVSRNGAAVRLESKVMAVLVCLARQPGNPLTKEALLTAVWPDAFVTEDALKRCISELRRVLEDDAREPRIIETIPKRGYRLIAQVSTEKEDLPTARSFGSLAMRRNRPTATKSWKAAAAIGVSAAILILCGRAVMAWKRKSESQAPGKIRLVVLPFQNLSGDASQDFFSAGLTDELTTQLGRVDPARLGVIASTSSNVMPGKSIPEIARILNVQYLLEGSVRRNADQVRIDAQLIQASDQTHIWASSFTRNLTDVLKVQTEVSEEVARQIPANLHITPSSPPPSVDPRAHDAYLKGRFYLNNRTSPDKSVELFEEATRLDPSYAPAFASLAQAYNLLGEVPYNVILPQEAQAKSLAAARHALGLDDASADAHASLGIAAFAFGWDLKTAEHEYRIALELDPNHASAHEWLGMVYMAQGKTREALEEGQRSLDLDPVSPACHAFIAQTYYFAGDYDKAADEARRILEVRPQFLQARYWLGSAYAQKKMYPEAIEQFRLGRQLSRDAPVMVVGYGYAQGMSGDRAAALATLRELEDQSRRRYISPIYFVGIYLGLGDKKNALKFLNQAFEERNDRMIYLNVEPMVNPLRSEPEFQNLLRRLNASIQE